MGTYDCTGTGSSAGYPFDAHKRFKVLERNINFDDIIALNDTLTDNAKITSGDVLQILKVPADFVVLGSAIRSITAEGSATTVNLGIGGSDEAQSGASLNESAGDILLTLVGDSWGANSVMGYGFEAADTIDFTAAADIEAGEWQVFVWGIDISPVAT